MADKPADIAVRVGADITGLTTGLGKAKGELRTFGSAADGMSGKMNVMAVAATAAAVGIGALVSAQIQAITTNRDLALQLDTTTNSVTALKRAADLAGISQGAIESASKKLSITLAQAADGTGKAAETLERLGLTASELQSMPLDERIMRINQAIATNIPATERAAVAAQLFGKNVANSIQLLTPETIAQANKEIEAFGLKVSEVDAAALDAADEAMQRFGMAAKGAGTALAVGFAPSLEAVGNLLLESSSRADDFGVKMQGAAFAGTYAIFGLIDRITAVINVLKIATGQFKDSEEAIAAIKGQNIAPKFEKEFELAVKNAYETARAQVEANRIKNEEIRNQESSELKNREKNDEKEIERARKKAQKLAEIERKRAEDVISKQIQEKQAKEDMLASGIEAIRMSHADELELLDLKYAEERRLLEEAIATNAELARQSAGLINQIDFDYNQKRKAMADAITEEQKKQKEEELQFTIGKTADALAAVGELMAGGNKKQFELAKKLGLAAAAISMYQGIAQALTYGTPGAVAAGVAYATATGLKSIQQIKAQQYGGGASGGGVGAPRLPTDTNAPGTAATGGGGNTQNIYVRGINPNQFFSGQQLLDLINAARDNGGNLRTA